jgi:hypothetical protein
MYYREQHHGRVVDSFWCTHLESGIALTERRRRFPLRAELSFHRESDWATKQSPGENALEMRDLELGAVALSGDKRAWRAKSHDCLLAV